MRLSVADSMNSFDALLASGVPDPTEFPDATEAPGLRALDAALRCTICSELLDAPVTLQCGHCFCSLCIRSALGDKQECPSCRRVAKEGHLRVNPAVEDAIMAWKAARPFVLRLTRDEHRRARAASRLEKYNAEVLDTTKKRKRSRASSSSSWDDAHAGPSTTSAAFDGTSLHDVKKSDKLADIEDGGDNDVIEVTELPALHPMNQPESSEVDAVIVECPLCQQHVEHTHINSHIDLGCPQERNAHAASQRRSASKHVWSQLLGASSRKGKEREASPDPSPLPKATYIVLKDRQLKDLLSEHGLPLTGDRKALVARHERWVVLYNANLDRSPARRQTLTELRAALKKWEVRNGGDRNGHREVISLDDLDLDEHHQTNKARFKQLVDLARPKRPPLDRVSITAAGVRQPTDVDDSGGGDVAVTNSMEKRDS